MLPVICDGFLGGRGLLDDCGKARPFSDGLPLSRRRRFFSRHTATMQTQSCILPQLTTQTTRITHPPQLMMQGDTALARPANRTRSKQAASTTLSPARQEHTTTGQEDDKSPQSTVEKSSEGAGHAIASTTSHNKRSREEISGVAAAPGPRRRTTRGGAITSTRTTSSSSGNGPVTVKQEAQVSSTPREAVPVVVPIVPVVQAERSSRAAAALAKLAFHSTNIANTGGSSHAGGGNNAAGGQSRASDDINTKKVTYRKCHYVSEAPQRLELVADRHSKGTLLNATIRIKPPDVRMKAFGWSHRGVNFFALALMSAKGERILPELYKDVPLRYRIAALETKMDSKGEETTTEEVYVVQFQNHHYHHQSDS